MDAAPPAQPRVTSGKVSNLDRVIDPSTGLKKVDLGRYDESINASVGDECVDHGLYSAGLLKRRANQR